jgi:hypothetical protein
LPQYKRLREEGRTLRRTIADAIEVLRQDARFKDTDRARIQVGGLRLPSQETVGLVGVLFDSLDERTFIVSLPTSGEFRAKRPGHSKADIFDIFELDDAIVDGNCAIQLRDGTVVRAVEVVPALLPHIVTETDLSIVHQTIELVGAKDETRYRFPADLKLLPADGLDCGTLPSLQDRIPLLKRIKAHIEDHEPSLKGISEQQISDSLQKFGMRIPKKRPCQG